MKIKRIILIFSFCVALTLFGCKETLTGFWHLKFGTWKVDEFVGKEFSQFVQEMERVQKLERDENYKNRHLRIMEVGAIIPWGVGRALNNDENAFQYLE